MPLQAFPSKCESPWWGSRRLYVCTQIENCRCIKPYITVGKTEHKTKSPFIWNLQLAKHLWIGLLKSTDNIQIIFASMESISDEVVCSFHFGSFCRMSQNCVCDQTVTRSDWGGWRERGTRLCLLFYFWVATELVRAVRNREILRLVV
jgi:hypothetical protein